MFEFTTLWPLGDGVGVNINIGGDTPVLGKGQKKKFQSRQMLQDQKKEFPAVKMVQDQVKIFLIQMVLKQDLGLLHIQVKQQAEYFAQVLN